MAEVILECSFLIPFRRDANLSDGDPHAPQLWDWLDYEILDRFGGRTVAPGRFEGVYRDPDTHEPVFDQSANYIVAVPEAQLEGLRSLLSAACVLFQQKCIYMSIAGRVEFIEAPKHGTQ